LSTPSKPANPVSTPQSTLLAIDLGLRMGLARYASDGRLLVYRSHNLGTVGRLKRAVPRLLEMTDRHLFAEGDRHLFEVWLREADRCRIPARLVAAETWRQGILFDRQFRNGRTAKQSADRLARRVIEWSDAPRPTSLRHDAAEAILLGLWATLDLGWLDHLPDELRAGL